MENNSTRDQVPVTQEEKYLPELPEGCITQVISFTSCRDACVSACVSREFRSAADSDSVWEKFLPPDYTDILPRTVPPLSLTDFSSKKELFFYFCSDPILLDGGTKSINFDKDTGKKCITIGARELGIKGGDSPHYWKWRPHSESRFAEVAERIDVRWLEMRGKIENRMLSTKTTYGVYLVIKHADKMLVFLVMGKTPKENSEHCSKNRVDSKFGYCSRHCSSQGLRSTVAKTE